MKQLTLADEIVVLMLRDDTGDVRPDRWNLDEHLETVARRWGIEPESDLVKQPQGAPA